MTSKQDNKNVRD